MPSKKIKHPTHYFEHNRVQLVRGGRDYFNLLDQLIRDAQSSIFFQTYIFDEDETGIPVTNALKEAAIRGVNVFLLLDGYASQNLSKEFIKDITDSGIRFRWFEPLLKSKNFYFGRRLHHKVVVVDSYKSLVGGMNISNRYNDLPNQPAWLDWALLTEGEIGPVLEDICKKRMKYYRYKLNGHHMEIVKPKEICPVRVRVNDWVQNKRQISRSYIEMLNHASSHIIIMSPYFLPGNEIRRRMTQAAKRGVKIKVILAGVSDISIAKWAERYIYSWLLRNNIEIYEYQKSVLHGKIATYDNKWVTIGSYNVNNLSALASVELNLDVDHPDASTEAERQLNEIIAQDCERITQSVYNKKTHLLQKILQWTSYESLRLLLFVTTFYFKQKE
jgi:cardiolipin synthase